MSIQLAERAIELFEALLEQPKDTREAWLTEQCGEDDALLTEVKRLIAADQAADPRFRTDGAEALLHPAVPQQLGPYRVLEPIGRGGMGAVYRAERADGAFQRTVAIKVMAAGITSPEAERRFANERQLLARMQHPNIASLLDGGTANGQPYLVLEHINGAPFTHEPGRSTTQTLTLFCKVCAAVQYAHNQLILHRDIKPANVLLNAEGEPKLLDFGVAKLDQSLATEGTEDLTGATPAPLTLNYSAPERLLGEPATIAGDVYALGLYLYELLQGRRPYDLGGLTLPEAHKTVINSIVALPAENDLDLIVRRAIHQDAGQRYASVAALATDLERFLDHRPIEARGDDWRYQARLLLRRFKLPLTVAAVAAVALLGVSALAVRGYVLAAQQATLAEQRGARAESAVEFLKSAFQAGDPNRGAGYDAPVSEALRWAEQRIDEEFTNEPNAAAYVLTAIAEVHVGRSAFDDAVAATERALALLDAAPGSSPLRRANVLAWKSLAERRRGNLAAAEAEISKALALYDAASTTPDFPWEEYALALNWRGSLYKDQGQPKDARRSYLSALALHKSKNIDDAAEFAILQNNLAVLAAQAQQLDDAVYRLGLAAEALKSAGLDNTIDYLTTQGNRAAMLTELERYAEAEPLQARVVEGMLGRVGPTSSEGAFALARYAVFFQRQNRHEDALAMLAPYADYFEGEENARTEAQLYFLTKYALSLCHTGATSEGIVVAERVLVGRTALYPPEHWAVPDALSGLGFCHFLAGDLDTAESYLKRAHPRLVEAAGANSTGAQSVARTLSEIEAARAEGVSR